MNNDYWKEWKKKQQILWTLFAKRVHNFNLIKKNGVLNIVYHSQEDIYEGVLFWKFMALEWIMFNLKGPESCTTRIMRRNLLFCFFFSPLKFHSREQRENV